MNSSYNPFNPSDTITISIADSNTAGGYLNTSSVYTFNGNVTCPNIYNDVKSDALTVVGDAEFKGNLTIKGKDISETLNRIEERLAILHPNKELEERWDQLRNLRHQYLELEADIIEKETIHKILQK